MLLIQAESIAKDYLLRGPLGGERGRFTALAGLCLGLEAGESLGIIGPSGSGKTTAARCLAGWMPPSRGRVLFEGFDLGALSKAELRRRRRLFQLVVQDPLAALNPRLRVAAAVGEPLEIHALARGEEVRHRVDDLLREVGLTADLGSRFPFQLSGGQRQRVGIARALAGEPKLLIADEPFASLDSAARQGVQRVIECRRAERQMALILISHELSAVRRLVDRVIVLERGAVLRQGPTAEILPRAERSRAAAESADWQEPLAPV